MMSIARSMILVSVPDDEVPLGEGHVRRFDEKELKKWLTSESRGWVHTGSWHIGKRQKYHGLQLWLAKIDMRLLRLVSRVWGIRRREGAIWLVAKFSRQ